MNYSSFLYSVTAHCLTPINSDQDITISAGTASLLIKADSEQDAIGHAMKAIAAAYEEDKELSAIISDKAGTVCIMDDNGHIVNHFWNFRSHRI